MASCQLMRKPKNESATAPSSKEIDENIASYAAFCRQELGFEGIEIPALNCLDGAEVPMTLNGQNPTAEQYQSLSEGKAHCDQPSWLDGLGCINYNFVQHRKISEAVDLALICRKRKFSSPLTRAQRQKQYLDNPSAQNFEDLFFFESLGMIVTNKESGKTCFFDQVDLTYGGYVAFPDQRTPPQLSQLPEPKPSKEVLSDDRLKGLLSKLTPDIVWKKPFQTARNDRCTSCHDSGPWIHTPWLPKEAGIPKNSMTSSYTAIGPAFEFWGSTFEPTAIDSSKVLIDGNSNPQLCTTCHRIGREYTCKVLLPVATGESSDLTFMSSSADPKKRRWMPPPTESELKLSDEDFEKNWKKKYFPHYQALKNCCDNPLQEGCTSTKFGPKTN